MPFNVNERVATPELLKTIATATDLPYDVWCCVVAVTLSSLTDPEKLQLAYNAGLRKG
jgi:hypothetical protein